MPPEDDQGGYLIEQLTHEDIKTMSPEAIMKAQAEGKLARLLGASPEEANRLPVVAPLVLPAEGEQWTAADVDRAFGNGWTEHLVRAMDAGQLADLAKGETGD